MSGRQNRPSWASRRSGSAGSSFGPTSRDNRMTRSGFLKGLGVGAAGLGAAAVGLGGVASAQVVDLGGGACEVYPTNDPSQDVPNVQGAVATFTDVTLKQYAHGTTTPTPFNFGGDTVVLFTNVVVKGEGTHATKVVGGLMSFMVVAPVHPIIENIWFDGAYFSPLCLQTCNGVTIRYNKITDIVPIDIGFDELLAYGVAGSELMGGTINGDITIQGNIIDVLPLTSNRAFDAANGVGIHDLSGVANLNILDNIIHNPGDYGVYLMSFPNSTATVQGNHIHQRDGYVLNNPEFFLPMSGITIGTHPGYGYGNPGPTDVIGNTLYNIIGDGIFFGRDVTASEISGNVIHKMPAPPGFTNAYGIVESDSGVFTLGSSNDIFDNTVDGSGFAGITLYYNYNQVPVTDNEVYHNIVHGTLTQPYRAHDSLWLVNPGDQLYYRPQEIANFPHIKNNIFGAPASGSTDLYLVNMTQDTFLNNNSATGYDLVPVVENPHAQGPAKGPKAK